MEIKYPKTFTECPCCGAETAFAKVETDNEIEAGKMKKGSRTPFLALRAPIFDPNPTGVLIASRQIQMLTGFFDVCTECGTLYCVEMKKEVGIAQTQVQQQK